MTPFPSWSHLERLRWTRTAEGGEASSTATSPQARWMRSSKAARDGTVISPERKKPKKHMVAAARNIAKSKEMAVLLLGGVVVAVQWSSIPSSRGGVVGKRCLSRDSPRAAFSRATPDWSNFSRGMVSDCVVLASL